MKSTKTRKPLFERLQQGLTEGIQQSRGKFTLRTTVLPNDPPEITPEELTPLRVKIDMSQAFELTEHGSDESTNPDLRL